MIKITDRIKKSISKNEYYSEEQFVMDAKAYIKAIKEGRLIADIRSVSSSGMSRVFHFLSCEKYTKQRKTRYSYRQYVCFLEVLDYKYLDNVNGFRVHGCGMDMLFHTNYTIISRLGRMGFLSRKQVSHLEQQTPSLI